MGISERHPSLAEEDPFRSVEDVLRFDAYALERRQVLCTVLRVPFRPSRQMFTGREPVALLVVTVAIRQHEVGC